MSNLPQPPPSIPHDLEARRQAMLYRARGISTGGPSSLAKSEGAGGSSPDKVMSDAQSILEHEQIVMSSLPVAQSANRLFDDDEDGNDGGADPGKLLALLKRKKKDRLTGVGHGSKVGVTPQNSVERRRASKQQQQQQQPSSLNTSGGSHGTTSTKKVNYGAIATTNTSRTNKGNAAATPVLSVPATHPQAISPNKGNAKPLLINGSAEKDAFAQSYPGSKPDTSLTDLPSLANNGGVGPRQMAAVIGVTPTSGVDDISPFSSLSNSSNHVHNHLSSNYNHGNYQLDSPPSLGSTTVPMLPTAGGSSSGKTAGVLTPQPLAFLHIGASIAGGGTSPGTPSTTTTPTKQLGTSTPRLVPQSTAAGKTAPITTVLSKAGDTITSPSIAHNVAVTNGSLGSAPDVNSPTNNLARYLPPSRAGIGSLQRPMTPSTVRPPTQQRQVQSAMAWATTTASPGSPFSNNSNFAALSPGAAKTNGLSVVTRLPTKNAPNKTVTVQPSSSVGGTPLPRSLSHSNTPAQASLLSRQKQVRRGSHDTSSTVARITTVTVNPNTIKNNSASPTGYQPDSHGSDSISPVQPQDALLISDNPPIDSAFIENTSLPNPTAIPISRKSSQVHFAQKRTISPSQIVTGTSPELPLPPQLLNSDSFTNMMTAMPVPSLLGGGYSNTGVGYVNNNSLTRGSSSLSPTALLNPSLGSAPPPAATSVSAQGSTVMAIRGQSAQINSGRPATRQKHPRMALDLFGSGHSGGALGVVRQHGGGLGGGGVVIVNNNYGGLGDDQTYVFSSETADLGCPATSRVTPTAGVAHNGQSPVAGLGIGIVNGGMRDGESDGGLIFSTSSLPKALGTVSPMAQQPQQQVPNNVDFSCLFFKSENELDDEGQDLFPTKAQAQLQKEREKMRKGVGLSAVPPSNSVSGEWLGGGGKEDRSSQPLQPIIIESAWWFTDVEPELVTNNTISPVSASVPTSTGAASETKDKKSTTKNSVVSTAKDTKSAVSPQQQISQSDSSTFTTTTADTAPNKPTESLAPLSIFSASLNHASAQWDSLPITDGKLKSGNRRASSIQNNNSTVVSPQSQQTPRRVSSQSHVGAGQTAVASTPTARPLLAGATKLSKTTKVGLSASTEKVSLPVQLEITNTRPTPAQKKGNSKRGQPQPVACKELTDDDDEEVLFFDADDDGDDNEETQLYEMLVNRRKQQSGTKRGGH